MHIYIACGPGRGILWFECSRVRVFGCSGVRVFGSFANDFVQGSRFCVAAQANPASADCRPRTEDRRLFPASADCRPRTEDRRLFPASADCRPRTENRRLFPAPADCRPRTEDCRLLTQLPFQFIQNINFNRIYSI